MHVFFHRVIDLNAFILHNLANEALSLKKALNKKAAYLKLLLKIVVAPVG